jgi:small-conductance mechanosensitive channel/CRP-like cAMP-binding protein
VEQLLLSAAVINLFVVSLLNPIGEDRVPDAFPSILQDAMVIGLLVLVATFVFHDKLLTTSAVSAVVVGFALQDTLGNAFAGLAIQSEKPFNVGHWVRVADFEGRVTEVTWRATKMRTKAGNFVIVPNNVMAKEAITNFSEPALQTRLFVEVGATYLASPAQVKAAILEAIENVPGILETPPADVLLQAFDASAITYRARFWTDNFERDEAIKSGVRTAIYYAFERHGIEIPWPIQVEYSRTLPEPDPAARQTERQRLLEGIDVFRSMTADQRNAVAAGSIVRRYGNGEAIVRQGQSGESMYVVCSGAVSVALEDDPARPGRQRHEIATIDAGGYFGEMSLLTGAPRTASVIAKGDTTLLEIGADLFRRLGAESPQTVEQIGVAAITRRTELEAAKAAASGSGVVEAPANFVSRMKKFLRIA